MFLFKALKVFGLSLHHLIAYTQIFNALNYYYCKMFIVEDKIF